MYLQFPKTTTLRKITVFLAFAVPTLAMVSGGISRPSFAFTSLAVLLYIYLSSKDPSVYPRFPKIAMLLGGFFVIAAGASAIYSYNAMQSLLTFGWLLIAIMFAFEIGALVQKEGTRLVSWGFIILGTVASLVGWYFYLVMGNYAYLRMIGPFFSHNPFAAALFLPVVLSVAELFSAKTLQTRKIAWVLAVFLGVTFLLTISRGALVALVASSLVVGGIALYKKSITISKAIIEKKVVLIVLVVLLSYGAYFGKMHFAPQLSTPTVAATEALGASDNPVTSRIAYMKIGVLMAKDNPAGVGYGAYRFAEPQYRTSPVFQTIDPHNLYVRMFAETGVVGGLSLLAFFVLFGVFVLRRLFATSAKNPLSPAVFAYAVAALAYSTHSLIEADWHFNINVLFTLVAFAVTYVVLTPEKRERSAEGSNRLRIGFIFLALIIAIFGMMVHLADLFTQQGALYMHREDTETARPYFERAMRYNPLDMQVPADYANFLFDSVKDNKDLSVTKPVLLEGNAALDKAIKLSPHSAYLYDMRGYAYRLLGNEEAAVEAYKQAIKNDPTTDLQPYLFLTDVYAKEHKYEEEIALIDSVIAYYPNTIAHNTFWVSPQRKDLLHNVLVLKTRKADALRALGRGAEADELLREAFDNFLL